MPTNNTLKQRIQAGEIVSGTGVTIDHTRSELEDLLSNRSFDYLYIDSQHSAFSEQKLVKFCAIAEDLDIDVQLRIPHTQHTYLIGRYLDLGPTYIMVPEVESEASVDEAIKYFYYPHKGRRSCGGIARRGVKARGGSVDRLEYGEWWNNYGVLAIQLESIEAIINARKLAKPGIDVLAFGPNDLLYSLEAHPKQPFKTVDECIQHVADQMKDTTVRLSIGVGSPEEFEKYREMGVTVYHKPPAM